MKKIAARATSVNPKKDEYEGLVADVENADFYVENAKLHIEHGNLISAIKNLIYAVATKEKPK
jgi:hypothetical protein